MSRPVETLIDNSSGPWTIAGIRDCWLGGSHHKSADREIAEGILLGAPHLGRVVSVYRDFLGRVVRYLVGAGVRQFLDLGSGLPTAGNVHEVAQDLDHDCRVVYVDIDPEVVEESHDLLAGNHNSVMVRADLRQPEQVLEATRGCGLLNLDAPVAVLAIDVLHHIPDTDNPVGLMAAYLNAACPGSYLSIAHSGHDESLVAGLKIFEKFYHVPVPSLAFRNLERVAEFFDRLDLVDPGIVPAPLWHPELNTGGKIEPECFPAYCGLGRTV